MTAHLSDQETRRTGVPVKALSTTEWGGRVRVAYFSFTTPTGGAAVADTVALTHLPAGARVLGGHMQWPALSSGAGTAQATIGTAADPDAFLAVTSVDAAGTAPLATTAATGYGALQAEEAAVIATVAGEAWAADKTITGHILYVLD